MKPELFGFSRLKRDGIDKTKGEILVLSKIYFFLRGEIFLAIIWSKDSIFEEDRVFLN